MSKKKWGKPKLIVLVREKPEEAVLSGCKSADHIGEPGYPYSSFGMCDTYYLPGTCYDSCSYIGSS